MKFRKLVPYALALGVAIGAASAFPTEKPLISRIWDSMSIKRDRQTPNPKPRRAHIVTITNEYFGRLPLPEDHPLAKCFQYRFEIRTDGGLEGFSILDFEDPKLRAELTEIDRRFNVGDRVKVKPTGAIFSLSLDRIIRPNDLKKY